MLGGRLARIGVALSLVACGGAAPTCPSLLPAQHLFEGYCEGGPGFCFVDHEVPF